MTIEKFSGEIEIAQFVAERDVLDARSLERNDITYSTRDCDNGNGDGDGNGDDGGNGDYDCSPGGGGGDPECCFECG